MKLSSFGKEVTNLNNWINVGLGVAFFLSVMKLFAPKSSSASVYVTRPISATYGEAVGVIMNYTPMLDSSKKKIIAVLRDDRDADYYKAVINIVRSNVLDSTKVSNIEAISK